MRELLVGAIDQRALAPSKVVAVPARPHVLASNIQSPPRPLRVRTRGGDEGLNGKVVHATINNRLFELVIEVSK